jgi:hypothetical protein
VAQGAQSTDLAYRHRSRVRSRVQDDRDIDVVQRAACAEHHSGALNVVRAEAVAVRDLVAGFPDAAHHSRGTTGELLSD